MLHSTKTLGKSQSPVLSPERCYSSVEWQTASSSAVYHQYARYISQRRRIAILSYYHVPSSSLAPVISNRAVMVTPMGGTFNLLLPPLLLAICAGLSIGLTFAPCYSSLCVEHFFPYQARIHIGVYYALLAVITLFLTARVLFRSVRRTSASHISDRVIPFVGKRLSFGGLLYGVFVAAVTFATVGYWYPKQQAYWYGRAELAHWTGYMYRVIWTGVTGHWCDIWMGLVIIPVGRRSILGQVFHLHTSTLLFAHKALAYSLCVGALIHGLLYYVRISALKRCSII